MNDEFIENIQLFVRDLQNVIMLYIVDFDTTDSGVRIYIL